MKRPGWSNSRVRSLRSVQNSSVIWKSLPWWHIASTKARSRATQQVGGRCWCRSSLPTAHACRPKTAGAQLRNDAQRIARSECGPGLVVEWITRSLGAADNPLSRWLRSPVGHANASGSPSTGALALRRKRPRTRCDGLPQRSSPRSDSANVSPTRRNVGNRPAT